MKKVLFVINTMGRAGAERALLGLMRKLGNQSYEVSLYVLLGQGELIDELPSTVRLLNSVYSTEAVLSKQGRRRLVRTVLKAFLNNGRWTQKAESIVRSFVGQAEKGNIQMDKLLWRVVADGAERFEEHFDLAVAWIEGGAAYYTADWVQADQKAAFLHIDYEKAGYTRQMDGGCWERFDRIFVVSEEARQSFLRVYPEYQSRTEVFYNIVDQDEILRRSREPGGFSDGYDGTRLLTVGRLTYQKGYDIAIEAMKLLKDSGCYVRWYVLGDGDQRRSLGKKIAYLGLQEDFVLLGAVENPYPYFAQADLYVQASRFEGKSIAIQEAQILKCPVLASDCSGNRENVSDGEDGKLCPLTPEGVRDGIMWMMEHPRERIQYVKAADHKYQDQANEIDKLLSLAGGNEG